MIVAGIDAGGTSWKLIAARGPAHTLARTTIPTTTPDETITAAADWINRLCREGCAVEAIGLASFGPIDRNPNSKTFGLIGETPKAAWRGANPLRALEAATGVPCALDTDVNSALLAETTWGAGAGLSDVAYVTVGAGVGGAATVSGNLVGAPSHAEFGHFRPARSAAEQQAFTGACPYHGACVEGLASATAIEARWGAPPHALPDDHEAWTVVADILAQLCVSIAYLVAPQRIILGGGVMQRPILAPIIRTQFARLMNGYRVRTEADHAETYIVAPGLGADAGALGGVYLALNAARRR
ncbi:MAG: ROK family protein [Parvularculaceae bacterium]